jgi:hypothetical protein
MQMTAQKPALVRWSFSKINFDVLNRVSRWRDEKMKTYSSMRNIGPFLVDTLDARL